MDVERENTKRAGTGGRIIVKRYCGNENALKLLLKVVKIIHENSGSGGDIHWEATKQSKSIE